FFFLNDTATTEIYTLSLHDALPILTSDRSGSSGPALCSRLADFRMCDWKSRSEEHTSELQSHHDIVFRLLLEKKYMLGNSVGLISTTMVCERHFGAPARV